MHFFVTGGAGFIGSHLVDRLLELGHDVTGCDNLSTGRRSFLKSSARSPRFRLVEGDTLDQDRLTESLAGSDMVIHLAANADVRFGVDHPRKDLDQNTIATFNVLEAMRANAVRRIAFSSTGSIYGDSAVFPTPEDAPFPCRRRYTAHRSSSDVDHSAGGSRGCARFSDGFSHYVSQRGFARVDDRIWKLPGQCAKQP